MADRAAVASDSSCATIVAEPTGTASLTAWATVLEFGSFKPLPDDYSRPLIAAIAERISVPSPLALGVYRSQKLDFANQDSSQHPQLYPTFSTEFALTFAANGSLTELAVTQESLAPAIDNALAAAIRAADSARAFPPINLVTSSSTLKVFIDVDLADCPRCVGSYPIFKATVPMYLASRPASQVPRIGVPKYPDALRERGIQGEVTLRLVIDESGSAVERTVRFTEISEVGFAQEVAKVIPRFRFQSARIGECPVKTLVEQRFQFKLDHMR